MLLEFIAEASAVSNLLQNAFKFTHQGGRVSLRALARENRVLIEVEDECGGLPPGKAEELFLPSTNGGDIHVKNLPGKGCVFTIELPAAA